MANKAKRANTPLIAGIMIALALVGEGFLNTIVNGICNVLVNGMGMNGQKLIYIINIGHVLAALICSILIIIGSFMLFKQSKAVGIFGIIVALARGIDAILVALFAITGVWSFAPEIAEMALALLNAFEALLIGIWVFTLLNRGKILTKIASIVGAAAMILGGGADLLSSVLFWFVPGAEGFFAFITNIMNLLANALGGLSIWVCAAAFVIAGVEMRAKLAEAAAAPAPASAAEADCACEAGTAEPETEA